MYDIIVEHNLVMLESKKYKNLELRMKYAQIDFCNTGRDGLRLKPT